MEKALLIFNIIYLILSYAFLINLICNVCTSKKRLPGVIIPILVVILKISNVVLMVLLNEHIIVSVTRDIGMILIWCFIAYIIFLYNEGIIMNRHHINNNKTYYNDFDDANEIDDNI